MGTVKTLFLNTFYAPDTVGGAEVVLQSLVEGVAAKQHEVVVLATTDQKGLHQDEVNGVRIWRIGIRNVFWPNLSVQRPIFKQALWHIIDSYNPFMGKALEKVLKIERPTVASVHNLAGWSVAAWSALHNRGVPIVHVLHDHSLICPRSTMFRKGESCTTQCMSCKSLRLFHVGMSRKVRGVVGVSRYILERHRRMGYFEGVGLQSVIPNARILPDIPPVKEFPADGKGIERPIRFGFIGSLHSGKGVEDLIRAFRHASFDSAELWIAGTGKGQYVKVLEGLSVGAPIRFLGRMSPGEFYRDIDVVVVPSRWNESSPMVVMEAMAYEKPVIATTVGGIPELVKDNKTGLLVKPNNTESLAEAMRRMLTHEDVRRESGDPGRKSAGFFLDYDGFIENHLRMLESVCL